jgi:hypothetical protein
MDKVQLVLKALKPKAKSFGFTKKELQSIAAKVADNLEFNDETSDEDKDKEINEKIDAIIPYLTVGQAYANRLRQELEDTLKKPEEEEEEEEEEEPQKPRKKTPKGKETPDPNKEILEALKAMREELTAIKGEKVTTSRKQKVEEALKDTGRYGDNLLKQFARMTFQNDDDFETYLDELKTDAAEYKKERSENGLSKGTPRIGGKNQQDDKPMTDGELDEIANMF